VKDRRNWTAAKAPGLTELEAMAWDQLTTLPKVFRDACAGVVIRVDDFATDEVLDELGAESEFDILACSRASACRSAALRTWPPCPI